MANALQKIVLSPSRDIPFNKLVLSQSNVRKIKAGVSIEQLAESIAQRTLLQGLSVRAIVGTDGVETGMYEVPAGGRRFRALELLVKQKRMSKTQLVPCIVRDEGIAEDDSIAENDQRLGLHPLDQFRGFQRLKDHGMSDEEIAARQFVSVAVVKQRLKLAAVSPKLLELYGDDAMTLDQLMAFTVTHDHDRQEQVWIALSNGWNKQAYYIKRLLTEGVVAANDRRALYVGVEAYEGAGGVVSRDLFEADNGGWFQDPALLERLVRDKLDMEAQSIQTEGWLWIEAAIDFPYGHTAGLRPLAGQTEPLTEEDRAASTALRDEFNRLQDEYAEADELPDEVDQRLSELETALEAFDNRPVRFDTEEIGRAGVFISLDVGGTLHIERGYVRYQDEPKVEGEDHAASTPDIDPETGQMRQPSAPAVGAVEAGTPPGEEEQDDDNSVRPISDRLKLELTSSRTVALRDGLANDPHAAFLAMLHVLVLGVFYPSRTSESCLEVTLRTTAFITQAPGLAETISAKAIDARRSSWKAQLPANVEDLWDFLVDLDTDSRQMLFAHCVSLSLNAQHETWNNGGGRQRNADQIAQMVDLDMVAAGWVPTVDSYLNRVSKSRILEAVREGRDERSAQLIDHLKKGDMAKEAERLLAGSGWLPELLRTPKPTGAEDANAEAGADDSHVLPAFLAGPTNAPIEDETDAIQSIAAE